MKASQEHTIAIQKLNSSLQELNDKFTGLDNKLNGAIEGIMERFDQIKISPIEEPNVESYCYPNYGSEMNHNDNQPQFYVAPLRRNMQAAPAPSRPMFVSTSNNIRRNNIYNGQGPAMQERILAPRNPNISNSGNPNSFQYFK